MGINHFTNQYYHQYRRKNLVLITENYDQINPNDIDIPLSNQNNDLSRIMKTSKKLTKYDCDIFQLVHSQPTNIVP